MKRALLMLVVVVSCIQLQVTGQGISNGRDKFILLTMPYNKRPLTLYSGQLQADAGYKFAVRAQSFNQQGELVNLKNYGTGSVYHYYFIKLRYGVLNFAEIGAETSFLRTGVRDATLTTVSASLTSTERVTVNKLTESKGMEDIFIYSALRLPIEYKWFDFGVKGGVFIPSAKYEPVKPSNTIKTSQTESNTYTINLHYNNTNGYGVPVYLLAGATKITLGKFTAEVDYAFRTPMKEGQNIRWQETKTDNAFAYADKSYSYLLSNTHSLNSSFHYQATGWFNIFINGSYNKTTGGWTDYWGIKYSNPEKRIMNFEPGFELQVSPSLTIYQVAGFPSSGKNMEAPFYLFTTISFNMFPFLK
jgi:hypothetical protein